MSNQTLKVQELPDIAKILDGSMFAILHENLGIRKLFAKWVPYQLKVDQKQQ